MATNLRLPPDLEDALRLEAERTGRSQQELIRDAVRRCLGITAGPLVRTERDALVSTGAVLPERTSFRDAEELVRLPDGVTTLELLDRDDRI